MKNKMLFLSTAIMPFCMLLPFYLSMAFNMNASLIDPLYVLINYSLFLLLTLAALLLPGYSPLYLSVLYLLLIIPITMVSSYMAIYRQPLDTQVFYFLCETNTIEASEYLLSTLNKNPGVIFTVVTSIFLPIFPLICIFLKRRAVSAIRLRSRLASSILCLLPVLLLWATGMLDANAPYNFYRAIVESKRTTQFATDKSAAAPEKLLQMDISGGRTEDARETYVVVIGESASRHHLSLYGYPRSTDPRMSELADRGELFAFRNVNSNFVGTINSLLRAFSFMDQFTPNSEFNFSVVDIFNRANFKTFWLSNNDIMPRLDNIMSIIWRNSDVRRFTERKNYDLISMLGGRDKILSKDIKMKDSLTYDDSLIGWYGEALKSEERKKVIFVHLKGSHVMYWCRYPDEFEKFRGEAGLQSTAGPLSEQEILTINDYDNSIYYTDHILGELVEMLRDAGGESWLMYFGDHGNEMYEYRKMEGRGIEDMSKYMFDVPMLLWLSEDYKRARDTNGFEDYLDRPYELDSMIHTIMDLAHIRTDLLDPSKSVVSEKYVVPPRFIHGNAIYLELPPDSLYNPNTIDEEIAALNKYAED